MTRILDIPQAQWSSFFGMLNGLAGRPVRLEVVERELGDQEMGSQKPLRTLDFEPKGAERGDLIIAVGEDDAELMHLIVQPVRMAMGISEAAEPEWIGILEEDGGTTILHFERLAAIEAEYPLP